MTDPRPSSSNEIKIPSKKLWIWILLALSLFWWGAWTLASDVLAISASGQAGAEIVLPLMSITSEEPLAFGQVKSGTTNGTVIVSTQNLRTATGGARLIGGGAEHSRAEFAIIGEPNATYDIRVSGAFAKHDQQAKTLDIVDLTSHSTTRGTDGPTGRIGIHGTDRVYVGGTLDIPANAKNGKYIGEITLSVNY